MKVDAFDAGGDVLGSVTLSGSDLQLPFLNGVSGSECNPPTGLPASGAQQPVYPATAKQAVLDLFALAWSANGTDAQKFSAFDDSHGFEQAEQELRTGPEAAEANSTVKAQVDNIVFLTPTEAAIQYTFYIAHYGSFTGFFGEATLSNGTRKLTRSTFCDALVTTNARCLN